MLQKKLELDLQDDRAMLEAALTEIIDYENGENHIIAIQKNLNANASPRLSK